MSAVAAPVVTRSRWPWVLLALYLLSVPGGSWLTSVNGRSWLEPSPALIPFTAFGVIGVLLLITIWIAITSAPGLGTTVSGTLPIAEVVGAAR